MSFIKMGEEFSEAAEDQIAPEGRYAVQIISAQEKEWKGGQKVVQIGFKFTEADFPPFGTLLKVPPTEPLILKDGSTQDDEKWKNMCRMQGRDWARFVKQFDVPHDEDGVDTNDLVGLGAEAHVVLRRIDDQNRDVNDLRLDRLPEDRKARRKAAADDEGGAEEPTQALARTRRRTRAA